MAEHNLSIDDDVLKIINDDLKSIDSANTTLTAKQIGEEAFAVYKWVLDQTKKGNLVVSAKPDGSSLTQIVTPHLPRKPLTK